jgi:hypothetical protein
LVNQKLLFTAGESLRKCKGGIKLLSGNDDSIDMFRNEFSKLEVEKERVRKKSIRNNFYK